MNLRVIYWLRQGKTTDRRADIPRITMPAIRRALKTLRSLNLPICQAEGPTLFLDR